MSLDQDALAALRKLARASRFALPGQTCDDGHVPIVRMKRDGSMELEGHIEQRHWFHMFERGLVVCDNADVTNVPRWRIANAGRIALKRALSRTPEREAGDRCGVRNPIPQHQKEDVVGGRALPKCGEESPLEWLRRRKDRSGQPLLTDAEFHAGERLRADFTIGMMMASVTANWTPVAGGSGPRVPRDGELTMSEAALDARERCRDALDAVGPELSGVLIDVCCHLKGLEAMERDAGWPQRSGKVILQMALRVLARHYAQAAKERDVPSNRAA